MRPQSPGDVQNYIKQLPDSEKEQGRIFQTWWELCTVLSFSNNSPWRKRNILIVSSLSYFHLVEQVF